MYSCCSCGEKSEAKKYTELCCMPEVFIVNIIRFDEQGEKITGSIEYPETIDLKDYQSADHIDGQSTKYKLICLAEHVGHNMSHGHYTSHTRRDKQWWKFDDEHYQRVSESSALNRQAYLMFYQRVTAADNDSSEKLG